MFEITVNFHDNSSAHPKRCGSYSELSSYLERIPNMLGFPPNDHVTITITTTPKQQTTLFANLYSEGTPNA